MAPLWNFADVWETVADVAPDAPAQRHADTLVPWSLFDACADGVARLLLDRGTTRGDKVALYLHNGPEYLQAAFACLKIGLAPVNTNYRYRDDELAHLWADCDAVAVVFHAAFADRVDAVRARCPTVRTWICVTDPGSAGPDWAEPWQDHARTTGGARVRAPWGRSGDDLILIYTGGTTGRPRGVMWRQHDLYLASNTTDDPESADLSHVRRRLLAAHATPGRMPVGLPAAPLMHGTAFVFACTILNRGGRLVTVPGAGFDAARLLDTLVHERVTDLCFVGDAFGRPIVDALDAAPGRWDLHLLRAVSSSGMIWSADSKARLLAHAPGALLIDFLNSSEASGMGRSITSTGRTTDATRFRPGRNAWVIDEAQQPVAPGSGGVGRIAVRGHVPLGYYKDPARTAATFVVIGGMRCSIPGDFARLEADGSITLLGRGSASINTAGEKVFPDEVEACIRQLPWVRDVAVVGVPDPRFGELVTAVVETSVQSAGLEESQVTDHVRSRLAGYKAPRRVLFVDSLGRGPNGKADYPALRRRMQAWLSDAAATPRTPGEPA